MGQTLTHGVYLPDEGERNCYDGLASNWSILDGAVGTVAEHTSALSGKAPLVHTHTKSDITDFPAYGNAAGTICEGNDSRLSDARTPVAHTHTKSDVTDLLNSDFIPAANNSYNLGSSSYQWNNLYAKNYFYNGTAWGLDKSNTWSADQKIQNASLQFKNTSISKGSSANVGGSYISLYDKDNKTLASISTRITGASRTLIELHVENTYKNGTLSTDSDAELISSSWYFGHLWNGTPYYSLEGYSDSDLLPRDNKNLGSSTYKWKTLNGINPGALSLPDLSDSDPIDTRNWVGNNSSSNQYTPTENGWIYFRVEGANKNITIRYGGAGGDAPSITSESTISHLSVFFPVRSGVTMYIFFNGTMAKAFFYPCLGNV